jgi:hypothetical protein
VLPKKPGSIVFVEGARSLKMLPKGSAIRERVRGGGGGGRSPAALGRTVGVRDGVSY